MSSAARPGSSERWLAVGLAAGAVVLVALIAASVLFPAPGGVPAALTVSVTSTGGMWTLEVVTSDPSLRTDGVYFLTRTPSGEPYSPLTALASLTPYFFDDDPKGALNPGDRVVLPKSEFPAGLTFWFLETDRLLAIGTLA